MIKKSFNNTNPTLYLVSTPIGNMQDITQRAIETLGSVDIIACEDTRTTGSLIAKLGINKPKLVRFDLINENKDYLKIIEELKSGKNIAVVSDAGTPIISDPGFPLVKACKELDVNVVPIPGACAAVAAVSVSGFDSRFYFYGFLHDKEGKRTAELEMLKNIPGSIVLYVSPYKLEKTIMAIQGVFGDAQIFVAKEITKLHETYYYGTCQEVLKDLPESIKGEYVLVIDNHK